MPFSFQFDRSSLSCRRTAPRPCLYLVRHPVYSFAHHHPRAAAILRLHSLSPLAPDINGPGQSEMTNDQLPISNYQSSEPDSVPAIPHSLIDTPSPLRFT